MNSIVKFFVILNFFLITESISANIFYLFENETSTAINSTPINSTPIIQIQINHQQANSINNSTFAKTTQLKLYIEKISGEIALKITKKISEKVPVTPETASVVYNFFKKAFTHVIRCFVLILLLLIHIVKILIGLIKRKYFGKKVNIIQML